MTDDDRTLWFRPPTAREKLIFLIAQALAGIGLHLVNEGQNRISEATYYLAQEPSTFRTLLIIRVDRAGDHLEVRLRRAQRLGFQVSADNDRVFILDPASMDGASNMLTMMLHDLAPLLLDRLAAVLDG